MNMYSSHRKHISRLALTRTRFSARFCIHRHDCIHARRLNHLTMVIGGACDRGRAGAVGPVGCAFRITCAGGLLCDPPRTRAGPHARVPGPIYNVTVACSNR